MLRRKGFVFMNTKVLGLTIKLVAMALVTKLLSIPIDLDRYLVNRLQNILTSYNAIAQITRISCYSRESTRSPSI